ncbi:hypothetical protein LCGC14_1633380 [marine sediment metagenome]|uniref:Uncharacterized protein n=1 Tax=marine sediment metagenome TaxID=412755 RepID=A0A0F9I295_9ZZZZ
MTKNKEDITVLCKVGAFVCKITHIRRKVYHTQTPIFVGLREYIWINKKKELVVRDPKTNNAFIQQQI